MHVRFKKSSDVGEKTVAVGSGAFSLTTLSIVLSIKAINNLSVVILTVKRFPRNVNFTGTIYTDGKDYMYRIG